MIQNAEFTTLLVPVDFSDNSKQAFQQAANLTTGDNRVVILLHVLDSSLPDFAETHGLGDHDEIIQRMRKRAQGLLEEYVASGPDTVEVDIVISEGLPFLEILQKSDDFAVDAIVMSKNAGRGNLEELLFGSTAEKVLRGSTKPVLVLPSANRQMN